MCPGRSDRWGRGGLDPPRSEGKSERGTQREVPDRHPAALARHTPQVDRDDLARQVVKVAYLTGTFTLRSGQTSTEYFDKFQFTSRPELLDAISTAMAALIPRDVEVLAGLQLGGVPLAAALSLKTGLPATYVRLERKSYGTCRINEGSDVAGRCVAIVEDVVTTGGQILLSTADLRGEGANVRYAIAVVDREQGGGASLADHGVSLTALFRRAEIENSGC